MYLPRFGLGAECYFVELGRIPERLLLDPKYVTHLSTDSSVGISLISCSPASCHPRQENSETTFFARTDINARSYSRTDMQYCPSQLCIGENASTDKHTDGSSFYSPYYSILPLPARSTSHG